MEPPVRVCCVPELVEPAFFRALADPNRLAILTELASCCGGSRTVGQIAEKFPLDLSVVSRHLAALRDAGLIAKERQGREVHYQCRYAAVVSVLRSVADAIDACCPAESSPRIDVDEAND